MLEIELINQTVLQRNDYLLSSAQILVEVCAASVEDAMVAQQCGAHRIELNVAMPLGGLTPSLGLVQEVKNAVSLPIIAMIRPRESGFCYSESEFRTMLKDIELLADEGVAGFATGFLDDQNQINMKRCREIRVLASDLELVFHRAFDFVAEPVQALEQLIEVGFNRVLTSGGRTTAQQGIEELKDLQQQANGRIEILPGAGIGPENVLEIVEKTGVSQVHGTFSSESRDESVLGGQALSSTSGDEAVFRKTDPDCLIQVLKALQSLPKSN